MPFGLAAAPDNHEPDRVIADIYASGLGLPDRDYYVKPEPRFQEAREKYRVHVAHVFELGGASRAASRRAADAVFAHGDAARAWRRSTTWPCATRRPPTTR